MSDVVTSEQQLTRRQLRELRDSAAQTAITAERAPDEVATSDTISTETLPLPTRRTMRDQAALRVRSSSTNAPRAAVLTTLGIATIAAPLTGFVTPEQSAQAIGPQVEVSAPLAETILAMSAQPEAGALDALAANPSASALSLELSARNQARTASVCDPIQGASGLREATTERTSPNYRPMAAGTYRETSQFGPRWGTIHSGLDMAAPLGTPIYAVADGEVVVHAPNGQEGRSGNLLIIHSVIDGQSVWFWYGHMYDNGVYVQEGDTVEAGQLIAGIGNKGFSTGPHLHFEVHVGEWRNAVDPATWMESVGAIYPGDC